MQTFPPFKNHPFRDFSEAAARAEYHRALADCASKIAAGGFHAAPILGSQQAAGSPTSTNREILERTDPSDASTIIGTTTLATAQDALAAVELVREGFHAWSALHYSQRATALRRAAQLMQDRSASLAALIIREAGKPWREADADVAEAIDFCSYYADEVERMWEPRRTDTVLGEDNTYFYQPRGVVAVISPWNFPLAITCGMAVAALVTGNTVILKPAEQTSLIASELAQILYEAGISPSALAFLPGRGEVVGRALVSHPDVALTVFTGSRPVGLEIIQTSASIQPGQHGIKRVIAELGGKNAIIVDSDADVDDAIRGVVSSAFGFAGQKCSACSRLIVVGSAYEPFLQRLASATRDLIIGAAQDPASFLGPVIDRESYDRITTIMQNASSVPLLCRTELPAALLGKGHYVAPTIFRDVPRNHSLWRDEIFGPVLSCTQATSFEEAIRIAVDSDYALTGGVFSRDPQNVALARRDFKVGNLYINRGITGALVGRQPFGGFNFSGIGSKAGGPDYLRQFVEPRVITENTMRRGFTPDIS
jgi:RHH-type proline utilization regulon transcriptional repressor/proline dehydrogenase/delta 1-pyrroline-5-carboxylate dehydrogenase